MFDSVIILNEFEWEQGEKYIWNGQWYHDNNEIWKHWCYSLERVLENVPQVFTHPCAKRVKVSL